MFAFLDHIQTGSKGQEGSESRWLAGEGYLGYIALLQRAAETGDETVPGEGRAPAEHKWSRETSLGQAVWGGFLEELPPNVGKGVKTYSPPKCFPPFQFPPPHLGKPIQPWSPYLPSEATHPAGTIAVGCPITSQVFELAQ